MNPLALHQLADIMEGAWNGRPKVQAKKRGWKFRVVPRAEFTVLFDRRWRIRLLWRLLAFVGVILFLVVLIAVVR